MVKNYDFLNELTPNKEILKFTLGLTVYAYILIFYILLKNWIIKSLLVLFTTLIIVIKLDCCYDSSLHTISVLFIVAKLLVIPYAAYSEESLINKYLDKLNSKFEEELNWRKFIDNFSDGVALYTEERGNFYQNDKLKKLFGVL